MYKDGKHLDYDMLSLLLHQLCVLCLLYIYIDNVITYRILSIYIKRMLLHCSTLYRIVLHCTALYRSRRRSVIFRENQGNQRKAIGDIFIAISLFRNFLPSLTAKLSLDHSPNQIARCALGWSLWQCGRTDSFEVQSVRTK